LKLQIPLKSFFIFPSPQICHSREINPQKIKVLIDSYVKIFKHRKKRAVTDEIF
jgi:hypothetical protein